MIEYNEKHIIQDCMKQCRIAQKMVYERYAPLFFTICLRYSKTGSDAEMVLQDSFLKIFSHINAYGHKGSFEGWMKKIVVNTCLDALKTKVYNDDRNTDYQESMLDLDSFVTTNDALSQMTLQEIIMHVQNLSDMTRNAFNLFVFEGYNHKEISELLGISVGTSQWHVNNARKILREKIDQASNKILKKKHEASKVG